MLYPTNRIFCISKVIANSSRIASIVRLPNMNTLRCFTAAVCTKLKEPLVIQDMPQQKHLKQGEIRVAIHNAGLNFYDNLMVAGLYQVRPKTPFIPGEEYSGEVVEVGEGTERFQPGDRVVGFSQGTFATETVVAEKSDVWLLPHSISHEKGAGMLSTYGTSLMTLKRRVKLEEGETVLITAAAGATGLAAVDIATNIFKAKVIAAAGSEEKCSLVRERGAFATIDYTLENIKEKVKSITEGRGADVVLDFVGGDVFDQCLKCAAWEGRVVVLGFTSGTIPQIPANQVLLRNISVLGSYWGEYSKRQPDRFQKNVEDVINMVAQQYVDPYIYKVYPLEQINEAMKLISERKSMGKIVISMAT